MNSRYYLNLTNKMTQYITIKDASELSGKSVQTIRRMIKSKKLKYRKDRTPQGFNYLIDFVSLQENSRISASALEQFVLANQNIASESDSQKVNPVSNSSETVTQTKATSKVEAVDLDLRTPAPQAEAPVQPMQDLMPAMQDRSHQQIVSYEPVKEFTDTMQKLIEQHGKEKENLFRLIETFQNKVISLENKIKVETNTKGNWFKFW